MKVKVRRITPEKVKEAEIRDQESQVRGQESQVTSQESQVTNHTSQVTNQGEEVAATAEEENTEDIEVEVVAGEIPPPLKRSPSLMTREAEAEDEAPADTDWMTASVVEILQKSGKVNLKKAQKKLHIDSERMAAITKELEEMGVISKPGLLGKRKLMEK